MKKVTVRTWVWGEKLMPRENVGWKVLGLKKRGESSPIVTM